MKPSQLEALSRALLYEGYLLYPYRESSIKNQRPFTFGGLVPKSLSKERAEPFSSGCELLLEGTLEARIEVRIRFLHPLQQNQNTHEEVEEKEVPLTRLLRDLPPKYSFWFESSRDSSLKQATLHGAIFLSTEQLSATLFKLSLSIENLSDASPGLPLPSMLSAHVILSTDASFVSLLDPPSHLAIQAEECNSSGLWPVLLGKPGAHDLVLCAPIILYDYPAIAEESAGDLFDGTEIDEILTLRILTLSETEKKEIIAAGGPARSLLERTEALSSEAHAQLHGAIRNKSSCAFSPGDKVRLHPKHKADIFDLALAGKRATIVSKEEDFEGRTYFTVIIDDDPGRDLGEEGKPGHRFFFSPEELEPLSQTEQEAV
jgi:hypothetical protein